MTGRKKVMFISCTNYTGESHGKSTVIKGIIQFLRGRDDVELAVVSIGPNTTGDIYIRKPGFLRVLTGMLGTLKKNKPVQDAFFWSPEIALELQHNILKFSPDIIIFDTMRTGQYLQYINIGAVNTVLYMDDLYSKRYSRIIATEKAMGIRIDVMGNFVSNLPALLKVLSRFRPIQYFLLRYEIQSLRRSESLAVGMFDKILLISRQEKEDLIERVPDGKLKIDFIKPNLVASEAPRKPLSERRFLLLGDLSVPHNELSTYVFIRDAIASFRTAMPDAKLVVIGKSASERLIRICGENSDSVELLGFVENLEEEIGRSSALIAPLLFGSGVKIKIMDAMKSGLPVVCSDVAAEGIEVEEGQGFYIVDRIEKYIEKMIYLADPEANKKESRKISDQFRNNYGQQAIAEQYGNLLLGKEG